MTGYKPTPAIVRSVTDEDRDVEVINVINDNVSFTRGWGSSGQIYEVVEYECPECGFDRMVRKTRVNPEDHSTCRYWCMHPNCVHFVRDSLSYATPGNYPDRDVQSPAVTE